MSRGDGDILTIAGKPYVWMRNEAGKLETVPFARVQVAMADIIAQAKQIEDDYVADVLGGVRVV